MGNSKLIFATSVLFLILRFVDLVSPLSLLFLDFVGSGCCGKREDSQEVDF